MTEHSLRKTVSSNQHPSTFGLCAARSPVVDALRFLVLMQRANPPLRCWHDDSLLPASHCWTARPACRNRQPRAPILTITQIAETQLTLRFRSLQYAKAFCSHTVFLFMEEIPPRDRRSGDGKPDRTHRRGQKPRTSTCARTRVRRDPGQVPPWTQKTGTVPAPAPVPPSPLPRCGVEPP